MSAIAYAVTATLPDDAAACEYIAWLADGHVQAVLAGGACSVRIVRILQPEKPIRVESRFAFPSCSAFERYERNFAPSLRADCEARFGGIAGVTFTRTLGAFTVTSQQSLEDLTLAAFALKNLHDYCALGMDTTNNQITNIKHADIFGQLVGTAMEYSESILTLYTEALFMGAWTLVRPLYDTAIRLSWASDHVNERGFDRLIMHYLKSKVEDAKNAPPDSYEDTQDSVKSIEDRIEEMKREGVNGVPKIKEMASELFQNHSEDEHAEVYRMTSSFVHANPIEPSSTLVSTANGGQGLAAMALKCAEVILRSSLHIDWLKKHHEDIEALVRRCHQRVQEIENTK